MIKNIGKFKQWTGEKFGGAKITLQTQDFEDLSKQTDHRREGYDKVVSTFNIVLAYLVKRKTSPDDGKIKSMPLELFGSSLKTYSERFPTDSSLGIALKNIGETERRIAALQEYLANEMKLNYLSVLETGLIEYKEYDNLRKKLASRRLDYDSKLNRLNKAKKEKPELEQEMQAARIKYEDTEHDLIQKMAYIQEFENEHRQALLGLVESQLHFHNQSREILLNLKSNWGEELGESNELFDRIIARTNGQHVSQDDFSNSSPNNTSISSFTKSNSMSRNNSIDTFKSSTTHGIRNSQLIQSQQPLEEIDSIHTQDSYEQYRRALYEFTGQNDDEIAFKAGDVITVINEIDKGWWVGEVHNKRGIFPVNYTEPYDPQKHPLPPLPNSMNQHEEQSRNISNVHHQSYPITNPTQPPTQPTILPNQTLSEPNLTEPSIKPDPSILQTPPNSSQESIQDKSDQDIPISDPTVKRNKSVAIRAPPPPPVKLSEEPSCIECKCHEYIENKFKPGHCNNCFHKHD